MKSITMSNNLLDELAYKYGSDKTPLIKHHYTQWYYPHFKDKRESIKKVLEIGVGDAVEMAWTGVPNYQTGASLRMWRDFFPNAKVYGADIKDLSVDSERIQVFQCNQASQGDLEYLISQTGCDLDLIIDDASHIPEHQVFTCKRLMPMMVVATTYVIEDVGHREIISQLSEYEVEEVKFYPRSNRDDRLLIVRHRG